MLEQTLNSHIKQHLTLCKKCLKGKKLLCNGLKPSLDTSGKIPSIVYNECERTETVSTTEEQLRGAYLPIAVINYICGRMTFPKVTLTEEHLKVDRKKFPTLAYCPRSCDMARLMVYYKIVTGLITAGFSCVVVVPHVLVQADTETYEDTLVKLVESDFVLVIQPEIVVPRSGAYLQVMEHIFLRIQDGLPTYVLPGDWDEFQRASTNTKHLVNGTLEFILDNCKAVTE